MKKTYFLFFLFNIILISGSYADNDDYNICATNADGAILVQELDDDHTSFALESSSSDFTLLDGNNVNQGGFCEVTPDNYKIKMYKMGLCKENPWTGFDNTASNTRSADLSSCINVFDVPAGKEANLTPGIAVNLLDNKVILPIGSFPYIYVLLDSVIQVKHIQEYALADGGNVNFTIRGYHPTKNDGTEGTGRFCYTGLDNSGNEFVNTNTNERSFTGATTLRGYALPGRYTGSQTSAKFHCGTKAEADAENDWFITIINNFGDDLASGDDGLGLATARDATNFRNAGLQTRGFHKDFPTIAQYYYLFNSSNTIATSPETVEKIFFMQSDTSNIVNISENTIGFKLNLKTNNALQIGVFQENGLNDEILQATEMNANSIFLNIQTKERRGRRGRTGDWR